MPQNSRWRGIRRSSATTVPCLTLGLVLDGSGFVSRSRMFAGNVREHTMLQGMLDGLGAPADALVVMDRGLATEAQIAWLRESGYRYLVVSRKRQREFDADAAEAIDTASGQTLHLDRQVCEDSGEVRLNCYSEARAQKERAMVERLCVLSLEQPSRHQAPMPIECGYCRVTRSRMSMKLTCE